MRRVGFAYAQARMQARRGAAPTAVDWQLIETGRSYPQCLDAANRTALAPYVAHLGPDSSAHTVEMALVESWALAVTELADWLPAEWHAPVRWFASLPHLCLIATAEPLPRLPGTETLQDAPDIAAAWTEGFRSRLAGHPETVAEALAPVTARFLLGPPRSAADTADLSRSLEQLFRIHPQSPVAPFAYLGLLALDLERLRGALVAALLLPTSPSEEAA